MVVCNLFTTLSYQSNYQIKYGVLPYLATGSAFLALVRHIYHVKGATPSEAPSLLD